MYLTTATRLHDDNNTSTNGEEDDDRRLEMQTRLEPQVSFFCFFFLPN